MSLTKQIEQAQRLLGDLREKYKSIDALPDNAFDNIHSLLTSQITEAYEAGRKSILDEMEEEQKKLLAGFSYRKN